MNISEKPELISVKSLGSGYDVILKYNGYSFGVLASREDLTFRVKNSGETEELLHVLEGILDSVKTAILKDELLSDLDKRIDARIDKKWGEQSNRDYDDMDTIA